MLIVGMLGNMTVAGELKNIITVESYEKDAGGQTVKVPKKFYEIVSKAGFGVTFAEHQIIKKE